MGITSLLLRLYRVDQQLGGLKGRLRQAENYLNAQVRAIDDLKARKQTLTNELTKYKASTANFDNEMQAIDERVEGLRERMNTARTSKEHTALLTEVNTLKADKADIEKQGLELIEKSDALEASIGEIDAQIAEREKVKVVAESQRSERATEIKDRVEELESERVEAAQDVPANAMSLYSDALERGIDEIMAPIEEADRRNMEYTCGSCFTHLPIERVSVLLDRGDLTTCPACDVILYLGDDLRTSFSEKGTKKKTTRKKKAAATPSSAE